MDRTHICKSLCKLVFCCSQFVKLLSGNAPLVTYALGEDMLPDFVTCAIPSTISLFARPTVD
jgi:hypothetical protein